MVAVKRQEIDTTSKPHHRKTSFEELMLQNEKMEGRSSTAYLINDFLNAEALEMLKVHQEAEGRKWRERPERGDTI